MCYTLAVFVSILCLCLAHRARAPTVCMRAVVTHSRVGAKTAVISRDKWRRNARWAFGDSPERPNVAVYVDASPEVASMYRMTSPLYGEFQS